MVLHGRSVIYVTSADIIIVETNILNHLNYLYVNDYIVLYSKSVV